MSRLLLDSRKERVKGGRGEVGDEPDSCVDGGEDHEIDSDGHPRLSTERHGQAADECRPQAALRQHRHRVSQGWPEGRFHGLPRRVVGRP